MIKIMVVFGTRPEAIKMAPVVRELERCDWIELQVCVTAQHREMLDQVLGVFDIKPAFDLDIMRPGQDLADVTARVMLGLRDIFKAEKPDIILVQGDTTTVFAAALAGFYEGVKVGHVEAGLRTQDKKNPFPEEINRRLTSVLTDVNFAPTERSRDSLIQEGYDKESIVITGNTVIDALFWALDIIKSKPNDEVEKIQGWVEQMIGAKKLVLVTAHRRESFGAVFRDMFTAMKTLANMYPEVHFVYPVHLNPNVRKPAMEILEGIDNFHLLEPMSYLPFVWLMQRSHIILTDSGGIQEEGPSLGVPVLVMRETTERPEGVTAGTSILVGRSQEKIISNIQLLLNDQEAYQKIAQTANPYGDGRASKKIASFLEKFFSEVSEKKVMSI
ncbi:MAG: UDP-N-acetylglucosamine 2-epimerase (non-hydrolyzing) [Planctomycetes bacterium]|nr:UDP-N-acetylglucosamine 2-epimerase (non-hydrolyzing) [Planctomycetota bacterium]